MPAFSLRSHSPDGAATDCGDDINLQVTTHLSTQKDERLNWLTYSGRFTHISGQPSAVGRAQDSESSPVKDQRSTAEPRNQPWVTHVNCLPACISKSKLYTTLDNCVSKNLPHVIFHMTERYIHIYNAILS